MILHMFIRSFTNVADVHVNIRNEDLIWISLHCKQGVHTDEYFVKVIKITLETENILLDYSIKYNELPSLDTWRRSQHHEQVPMPWFRKTIYQLCMDRTAPSASVHLKPSTVALADWCPIKSTISILCMLFLVLVSHHKTGRYKEQVQWWKIQSTDAHAVAMSVSLTYFESSRWTRSIISGAILENKFNN